jgi:hypothetical protein
MRLAGVDLLLIDGNNLLHRFSGAAHEGQQRLLLARLRGTLPADVRTILMLDGHAASRSGRHERIAAHLEVRHSGSRSADDALLELVEGQPPLARAGAVVVTDDRALTERVRTAGGRTQRLDWLIAMIGGVVPAGRATPPTESEVADEAEDERPPWRPGRGATRKHGNPHRAPRHNAQRGPRRHGQHGEAS